jgi:ABC-type Mn2+/Zn2+ transport system ATPase subunit
MRASEPASRPLVTLAGVDLRYGRRSVLQGIDLTIREGDFLGIVGPNGAGKSTLLKALLGLLAPSSGTLTCAGPRRAMRFGYVPQRESIDPVFPMTPGELVLLGRSAVVGALRWPGRADREAVASALRHVGIEHLADVPFRRLSGGQQQRVLIARALVVDPRILLLDEPTNGMDLESEHALMELIASFHREQGLTVVLVSHLLNVVVNYVKSLVLMDGERLLAGPLDEVLTEKNLQQLYPSGVTLARVSGRRVVLAGRG